MDVDHANSIDLNSGTVDLVSHASRSAQKRNVDMADWIDGANGSVDKKIKLDNVSSTVESSLSGKIRDGRLSSKVHPLAALPEQNTQDLKPALGDNISSRKPMVEEKLNKGDTPPTDMSGALSLSLAFPVSKEQ
ncbi:unnamed protein product [Triticum turgidum subsp. durum]|uniref:Uncharacterized protein n=1 Tax=Triticum turgidum subsp. durum TaxID=4567 RepID=A0A9R0XG87_TRITD|nr:unnamed protein product [Triticum turgidum subsp. durum]